MRNALISPHVILGGVLLALPFCLGMLAETQARTSPVPQAAPATASTSASRTPRVTANSTIILPTRLVSGRRATLAVLDETGRLTPGATVEFTGGERVTTDATGRALFTAPEQTGILLATLPDIGINASTTVVSTAAPSPDGLQLVDYPRFLLLSDRFVADGYGFSGEANANHITLGDQPALVLAASPISLVILPGPRAKEGPVQLLIEVGGRSPGPVPVTLVSIELKSNKSQLARKEKGTLRVRLMGTDQRLTIEARNLTPEIIELPRGNVQRVTTSGGALNATEIEMLGVRPGSFAVSARIVPAAAGLPDLESARQTLLEARKLATGKWLERVDGVLRRMERDPQDSLRVREELEKILADQPEGEFGRLVEAAWRALVKR